MTQSCSNCKFYSDDAEQVRLYGGILGGVCREDKPTALVGKGTFDYIKSAFPQCTPSTWCGKWTTT